MNTSRITFFFFITFFALLTCTNINDGSNEDIDYRSQMVDFVSELSDKARKSNPDFIVIAQNAHQLVTKNGKPDGALNQQYLSAIDGIARENLFYGYPNDNIKTPDEISQRQMSFLNTARDTDKVVMAVNYCSTYKKVLNSYQLGNANGYITFAAPNRELNTIPNYEASLTNENDENVSSLSDAQNFLYIINPNQFQNKADFLQVLKLTNYDVLVIDYVFQRGIGFTPSEIAQLKTKANGAKRLVIAYFSIGEAEDYRYYWDSNWGQNPPEWLGPENPNWKGNYPVKYWHPEWKELMINGKDSYLSRIVSMGYDGAYLDRVDSFWYFEEKQQSN